MPRLHPCLNHTPGGVEVHTLQVQAAPRSTVEFCVGRDAGLKVAGRRLSTPCCHSAAVGDAVLMLFGTPEVLRSCPEGALLGVGAALMAAA
jgi:hypothetical protein